MQLVVGTTNGVVLLNNGSQVTSLEGRRIGALSRDGGGFWALADGRDLLSGDGAGWELAARVDGDAGTCVLAADSRVLVGTTGAHVLQLEGSTLRRIESFESAADRPAWHTPWGGPPDVRTMCAQAGTLLVNVHVGGIQRSSDGGASWHPTIDIDADVHEVRAAGVGGTVVAACARGLAVSVDNGVSWEPRREGLPVTYARGVALAEDQVVLTVSAGPDGRRSGVYRTPLQGGAFAACETGLPAGYGQNIDSSCLDARDGTVAFGTREGRVFVSKDAGSTWATLERTLSGVLCLVVDQA